MTVKRLLFPGLILLALWALLLRAVPVAESQTGSNFVSTTTEECLRLIDSRNYAGARRLALKLAASPQWKNGELEAAGAIRAVVDAFRAARRMDIADLVLQRANQIHKATGNAALALQGRSLPESARLGLPILDLTWHPPMARDLTSKPLVFNPVTDLKRIRVGNQASLIKIMDATNKKAVYTRGLDGVLWAPVLETHRQSIFNALGISPGSLDQVATQLMNGYAGYKQKKECLALLGIIGSSSGPSLSDGTRSKLQSFLVKNMQSSKDVVLRRQACLNLALQNFLDPGSAEAVTLFYEKSKNLWETFPVQQFFEYQKDRISLLPNKNQIRARIAAIKEIYTPNILKFL